MIKKFIILPFVFLTFAFQMNTPAFATIASGMCDFNVSVAIQCQFSSDIKMNLTNIADGSRLNFVVTNHNGYKGTYKIPSNTTYKVTFSYGESDKYSIVNSDGTNLTAFPATMNGVSLSLVMKDLNAVPDSSKQGKSVLNDFLNKTQYAYNDNSYAAFFDMWSGKTFETLFLKIDGNTEDGWDGLSSYEKACYGLLVTYPKSLLTSDNSSISAPDENTFLGKLDLYSKQQLTQLKRGNEFYSAVRNVWEWHWQNWKEHKTFINLYEGVKIKKVHNLKPASSTPNLKDSLLLNHGSFFTNLIGKYFFTIAVILIFGITLLVIKHKNKNKKGI